MKLIAILVYRTLYNELFLLLAKKSLPLLVFLVSPTRGKRGYSVLNAYVVVTIVTGDEPLTVATL